MKGITQADIRGRSSRNDKKEERNQDVFSPEWRRSMIFLKIDSQNGIPNSDVPLRRRFCPSVELHKAMRDANEDQTLCSWAFPFDSTENWNGGGGGGGGLGGMIPMRRTDAHLFMAKR